MISSQCETDAMLSLMRKTEKIKQQGGQRGKGR